DWIGHTEYSETRIEQLDHIFNLIGITIRIFDFHLYRLPAPQVSNKQGNPAPARSGERWPSENL
ncbi:hypothetical protein ACK3YB_17210, partial [Aeromonas caviae]